VDSLQPPFSLIDRAAAEKEFPGVRTMILAHLLQPMQSGLLTRISRRSAWRRWRGRLAAPCGGVQQPRLGRNLALRDALSAIGTAQTSVVIAIDGLSWPGVSGAMSAPHAEAVDG